MTNRCENCKYFHELKQLVNGEWQHGTVCTVFPQTSEGYDAFALVVTAQDMCEMWEAQK